MPLFSRATRVRLVFHVNTSPSLPPANGQPAFFLHIPPFSVCRFFSLGLLSLSLSLYLSFTSALFVRGFTPAYPKGGMNYSDGGENV